MSFIKRVVRCGYCPERASLLVGPLGAARFHGWTRYGCANGHRFAIPSHQVTTKKAQE